MVCGRVSGCGEWVHFWCKNRRILKNFHSVFLGKMVLLEPCSIEVNDPLSTSLQRRKVSITLQYRDLSNHIFNSETFVFIDSYTFFYHLEIWTGNEYNCKQDWDNWIKY